MSEYIFVFRGSRERTPTEADRDAWMAWFGEIGSSIADFGNQVGEVESLGQSGAGSSVVGGYIVVNADNLSAAVALAKGCPGLQQGGGVEVGELLEAS